jgi:hypothetical protein
MEEMDHIQAEQSNNLSGLEDCMMDVEMSALGAH